VIDYNLLIALRATRLAEALRTARATALGDAFERMCGAVDHAGMRVFARTLSSTLTTIGFMHVEVRRDYERVQEAAISLSNAFWQAERSIRVTIEVER
jgi:hypothetical protein